MKTYKQFSEERNEMEKNIKKFMNNPETKDLNQQVKDTKIGDFKNLKDPLKKFTKSQAFQQLKLDSLTTLQNKTNMGVNKIFDTLKSNFNVTK